MPEGADLEAQPNRSGEFELMEEGILPLPPLPLNVQPVLVRVTIGGKGNPRLSTEFIGVDYAEMKKE